MFVQFFGGMGALVGSPVNVRAWSWVWATSDNTCTAATVDNGCHRHVNYWARTGTGMERRTRKQISRNGECKPIYGSVLMELLVMAGLQVNLRPLVEQNKTDEILTLGPYYGKNCLWLPMKCCTEKYRHRQLHGTWDSLHNSSQSAPACYNSTATPTVTQRSDYMYPLSPFWGITVCTWL